MMGSRPAWPLAIGDAGASPSDPLIIAVKRDLPAPLLPSNVAPSFTDDDGDPTFAELPPLDDGEIFGQETHIDLGEVYMDYLYASSPEDDSSVAHELAAATAPVPLLPSDSCYMAQDPLLSKLPAPKPDPPGIALSAPFSEPESQQAQSKEPSTPTQPPPSESSPSSGEIPPAIPPAYPPRRTSAFGCISRAGSTEPAAGCAGPAVSLSSGITTQLVHDLWADFHVWLTSLRIHGDPFFALTGRTTPHPRAATAAFSARATRLVCSMWMKISDETIQDVAAPVLGADWAQRLPIIMHSGNGDDQSSATRILALLRTPNPELEALFTKYSSISAEECIQRALMIYCVMRATPHVRFFVPSSGDTYDPRHHDPGFSLEDDGAGRVIFTAFPGLMQQQDTVLFRAKVWCESNI